MPVGTLVLPDPSNVRYGVSYGANGNEFVGTFGAPISDTASSHSPADVVRWMLVDMGQGTNPNLVPLQDWPIYEDVEPTMPDNCITLKDTEGRLDCRTMIDGEEQFHHGFQIRVRAATKPTAYAKANAMAKALTQNVYQEVVTIGTNTYLVQSISLTGDVIPIGKDTPNSKRSLFTVNGVVSLRQLT